MTRISSEMIEKTHVYIGLYSKKEKTSDKCKGRGRGTKNSKVMNQDNGQANPPVAGVAITVGLYPTQSRPKM